MKDWRNIYAFASLIMLIFGIVWAAAQYPTREEFEKVKIEAHAVENSIQTDLRNIRETQIKIQSSVEYIKESLQKLERSVDNKNTTSQN